jgi:adenylyltransferase/sulfurtransferase
MIDQIITDERTAGLTFSDEERARYSRHFIMPEVTIAGQRRLKAARVLCIGVGGLGSPATLYLAAAGVGTLGLVDADRVELSNLQRQILYGTEDVGRTKLDAARARIEATNPHIDVRLHNARFTSENAREIVEDYDIVIDGSDNFPTRYLSSDVCVFARKPNIYGSVFRFDGQATVFGPHLGGPCYRCLFPQPPPAGTVPNCAEAGVLGVLPGVIGMLQAIEAIKLIIGAGDSLLGRLLHFDALKMKFREFKLRRDPECPICGENPSIFELQDYEQFCAGPANEHAGTKPMPSITVRELDERIRRGEPLTLLDVREIYEHEIAQIDGGKLIPLGELPQRLAELPRDGRIAVYCHAGVRSAHAAELLQREGFADVYNVEGGIDAWSREIDPTVARY